MRPKGTVWKISQKMSTLINVLMQIQSNQTTVLDLHFYNFISTNIRKHHKPRTTLMINLSNIIHKYIIFVNSIVY